MEATATEVKNKFGKFSDIARNEPDIVEKTGRKAIVLIAFLDKLPPNSSSRFQKRAFH